MARMTLCASAAKSAVAQTKLAELPARAGACRFRQIPGPRPLLMFERLAG
jgi:hypothetical protein